MFKGNDSEVVLFESINVNAIDSLSGIFVGQNSQFFWNSHSKSNTGFGTIKGKGNIIFEVFNLVIDPDTIDNPSINN